MAFPFTDVERGLVGEPATEDPYLPFHAALETGILGNLAELARTIGTSPGVGLANGWIPNPKGAGVVDLGNGDLVVFDHAAIEIEGKGVNVLPTEKEAVENDGQIMLEGAILMVRPEGRLKIAKFAVDVTLHPWLATRLRGGRPTRVSKEGIAVFNGPWDISPELEIKDVNASVGIIQTAPRRPFF